MTIMQRKPLATTAIFLSLALVTGCHKKQAAAPLPAEAPAAAPAPTANITADPVSIDLGQSVVLNWRTTNATSVSIDGLGTVNSNGTQTVAPTTSTDYHLVAKGDGGTAEADVRVTVRVPEVPTAPASTDNTDEAIFKQNVQDVFFDYDSYDLRPDARTSIEHSAAFLSSHPGVRIVIGGYCDDRGSAEYNLALGENRANAAKTALVNAGVAANRIRVISYGKEKQFCTEENETCWQQNRRDQFSLDR
ncbi:MAG: OmpA family protein [Acidobacteriaceae bacterium]